MVGKDREGRFHSPIIVVSSVYQLTSKACLSPQQRSVSSIALPLTSDPDNVAVTLRAGTTTYLRGDPQLGIVAGAMTRAPSHVSFTPYSRIPCSLP